MEDMEVSLIHTPLTCLFVCHSPPEIHHQNLFIRRPISYTLPNLPDILCGLNLPDVCEGVPLVHAKIYLQLMSAWRRGPRSTYNQTRETNVLERLVASRF